MLHFNFACLLGLNSCKLREREVGGFIMHKESIK